MTVVKMMTSTASRKKLRGLGVALELVNRTLKNGLVEGKMSLRCPLTRYFTLICSEHLCFLLICMNK